MGRAASGRARRPLYPGAFCATRLARGSGGRPGSPAAAASQSLCLRLRSSCPRRPLWPPSRACASRALVLRGCAAPAELSCSQAALAAVRLCARYACRTRIDCGSRRVVAPSFTPSRRLSCRCAAIHRMRVRQLSSRAPRLRSRCGAPLRHPLLGASRAPPACCGTRPPAARAVASPALPPRLSCPASRIVGARQPHELATVRSRHCGGVLSLRLPRCVCASSAHAAFQVRRAVVRPATDAAAWPLRRDRRLARFSARCLPQQLSLLLPAP